MRTPTNRRGMTLLEVLASIVILGIIGAATVPIVQGSAESYDAAREARRSTEDASFAMDRLLRLLREAPGDPRSGTLFITDAATSRVEFADGRGAALNGRTLELLSPEGPLPLCRDVDALRFEYFGADGSSSSEATPEQTQRFRVVLTVRGHTLDGVVMARVRSMGGGS